MSFQKVPLLLCVSVERVKSEEDDDAFDMKEEEE